MAVLDLATHTLKFPGTKNKDGHVTTAVPVTPTSSTLPLPCRGARGAGEGEGAAPWPAPRQGEDRSCLSLLGARWRRAEHRSQDFGSGWPFRGSGFPPLLCPNQTNLQGPAPRPPGRPPHPLSREWFFFRRSLSDSLMGLPWGPNPVQGRAGGVQTQARGTQPGHHHGTTVWGRIMKLLIPR